MSQWYQSNVKYRTQDVNGKWKTISESFLHDGVSFSDVETQLHEILKERLKDFGVKAIKETTYSNVYDTFVGGDFYKVTIQTDYGDGKTSNENHLVAASDVVDAEKRAENYMKGWVTNTSIIAVVKSSILGVWHPKAEPWQEDFRERMAELELKGHKSVNANQTEINFDKKVDIEDAEAQVITDESHMLPEGQKALPAAPLLLPVGDVESEDRQYSDEYDEYVPEQSSIDKYNAVLDDISMQLSFNDYHPFNVSQFAKKHGIGTNIMSILVEMGALTKAPKIKQTEQSQYRKEDKFDAITAIDVLKHINAKKPQPVESV
ncbi:hypothetical protein GCM10027347_52820 [Larkinella harenae]